MQRSGLYFFDAASFIESEFIHSHILIHDSRSTGNRSLSLLERRGQGWSSRLPAVTRPTYKENTSP